MTEPLTLAGAVRLYRAYCAERDRMLAWLRHAQAASASKSDIAPLLRTYAPWTRVSRKVSPICRFRRKAMLS